MILFMLVRVFKSVIPIVFFVVCLNVHVNPAFARVKKTAAEKNPKDLGISLIKPVPPMANFVKAVRTGGDRLSGMGYQV